MKRPEIVSNARRRWIIWLIIGALIVIVVALFAPWNIERLASHPRPVSSYAEALQRIDALRANESPAMNPVCRLQFLTHQQKTERVIAFVHGYANCPQQFSALGKRFYDLGYNVLIAPLPHHGLADRTTPEQALLTAEELATYADQVVDIAQGLGTQVTLAGISGGGVVTAWAAQRRSDINLAVVISPGFGFAPIPTPLTTPAANLFLIAPNFFQWWDPDLKDKDGVPHAYANYSTRALAQILRLGIAVRVDAQQTAPATQSILVITNASDASINIPLVYQVTADWRSRGAKLATYEFGANLQLDHDLIDPAQTKQKVDLVYPILIDLLTK